MHDITCKQCKHCLRYVVTIFTYFLHQNVLKKNVEYIVDRHVIVALQSVTDIQGSTQELQQAVLMNGKGVVVS